MMREANHAAHKIMVEAKRVEQLAREVPVVRTQMHVMARQGGMPPQVAEMVNRDLRDRVDTLEKMISAAGFVLPDAGQTESPLFKLSDKQLSEKLWHLDSLQVRLDTMRDAIIEELDRFEKETAMLRRNRTEMMAASIGARMSTPSNIDPTR